MELSAGQLNFRWIENWAKLPEMTGFAHHGFVFSKDGNLVTGHATEPKILTLSTDGDLLKEVCPPVETTHGICLSVEGDEEFLWIADINGQQVVKCTMEGELIHKITKEDLGFSGEMNFKPTTLAVDSDNKMIWITDGYSSGKIFGLNFDYELKKTIDGSDGAGKFNCPHWVFVDTRKEQNELYVADRASNRVQVYDAEGNYLRVIDDGLLETPSVFSTFGDYMVIGELKARLVILDIDDKLVGYLGDGKHHVQKEGWPNRKDKEGGTVCPLDDIPVGEFNSPHGMVADKDGNIYVSEWLIGDRFTKLQAV